MALPFTTERQLLQILKDNNLLTPKVLFSIDLAAKMHTGQKRDHGTPYLEEHIFSVTKSLIEHNQNHPDLEKFVIIALLHDVVEDNYDMDRSIISRNVGDEILSNILVLTKSYVDNRVDITEAEKVDRNKIHIEKILVGPDEVKIVKLEDRLNNLACIDYVGENEKYLRHISETEEVFIPLARSIDGQYVTLLHEELRRIRNL